MFLLYNKILINIILLTVKKLPNSKIINNDIKAAVIIVITPPDTLPCVNSFGTFLFI